jgi:hypothetical protein
MQMNQDSAPYSPVNRHALISLVTALLALVSFFIGALPLPFTALFCYPPSVLLGITALWTGLVALQRIRQNGEKGQLLARIGIWIGSLTLLFIACAIALVIALWPSFSAYLREIMSQIQTR